MGGRTTAVKSSVSKTVHKIYRETHASDATEFDSLASHPMNTTIRIVITAMALVNAAAAQAAELLEAVQLREQRVKAVAVTPGCVAFWDFVKREAGGTRRFTAHVPAGATNDYALDAANYVRDYWGEGREATYADFPLLGRGPFGQAIRIRKEEDASFRPFLFVPRARLHDSPLDIKGAGKSVTVVVWAIRESGNHALAGIWHEGTDLKQESTGGIQKVERGQRQYALFAGLNKAGSACGHVSENGASSFLNRYALHKCNSAHVSPAVPADSPAEVIDASWQCFAMTIDHQRRELTGWLNGVAGDRWLENPKDDTLISSAYKAYMQGHLHRVPGVQPDEDTSFPQDQYYNPPEDQPLSVKVLSETDDQRVELHEYRYTKVEITLCKDADGQFAETARDLVALRLNPWWYPHGIYTPKDATTGGPFTIGRVIHSSRSVGFTGWIGGVAVFDRALPAEELAQLSAIGSDPPIAGPETQQSESRSLQATSFTHFITRQGDKLMEGDKEFRFVGANMPGLTLPYDWTLYLPERLHLPTPWEQEDGFKTLDQMNLRVVRLWNLPILDPHDRPADGRKTWHYVQGPGEFNEESFKVIDHLLALANKYQVRVIFPFTAEWGDYLGSAESWLAACHKEVASLQGQRPFFVGEFGPYIDGKDLTHGNVVEQVREFLGGVQKQNGMAGACLWSMYFHHQDGGFYWHQIMTYPAVWSYHWPGFPSAEAQREMGILQTLREAAFEVQGLPTPPVPVPDAPEPVPVGDVPLLTWRGSAGARGYDIQRAALPDGPWATLATNVSDADIAYRPLYSDTTARTGEAWYYRIIARNESGRSKPSNIMGPVVVKAVCLADELQDFSRVHAKSDGLKIDNDYNALGRDGLGGGGSWWRQGDID